MKQHIARCIFYILPNILKEKFLMWIGQTNNPFVSNNDVKIHVNPKFKKIYKLMHSANPLLGGQSLRIISEKLDWYLVQMPEYKYIALEHIELILLRKIFENILGYAIVVDSIPQILISKKSDTAVVKQLHAYDWLEKMGLLETFNIRIGMNVYNC